MKGRRKKIQHVFVYFVMLGMSAFLIMGGMRQLAMTHELRTSINQKQKEKKLCLQKEGIGEGKTKFDKSRLC